MTDLTARLDAIQNRAEASPDQGEAWTAMPAMTDDQIIMHRVYDDEGRCIAEASNPDIAEAIADSHNDLPFLLVLARKQQAALAEVEEWLKTLDVIEKEDPTTPTHLNVSAGGLARAIRAAMKSTLEAKP
jgi:hypothetical protein